MQLRLRLCLLSAFILSSCTTESPPETGAGKEVVQAEEPRFRATLAPGTFVVPLTFDSTAFAFDEARLTLVCQNAGEPSPHLNPAASPHRQTAETNASNSRISFSDDQIKGSQQLKIDLKTKLAAQIPIADAPPERPCFVVIATDLIAKADDSRWRLSFLPALTANQDGAQTAEELKAALAAAPAMRFNTIMVGAGSSDKICAEQNAACPWSARRLTQ
jgi:hypothetical protein